MEAVKSRIACGEYVAGNKLPTEVSLAEEFNCSQITSKKALDELEREGLVVRIKGSGSYVAEAFDRLGSGNSKNISMILPSGYLASNLMEYFYGASAMLSAQGYILHTASVNPRDNTITEGDLIQRTVQNDCAGIIYYPEYDNKEIELLTVLSMNGFPIVTIDKRTEDLPISSVVSDDYHGTYAVTKHLIENGHKNIAFISATNISNVITGKKRFMGYATALKDHGIKLRMEGIVNNYLQPLAEKQPDLYGQVDQILPLEGSQYDFFADIVGKLRKNGITAAVCVSDIVAMYIMKTCEYLGLSVPGDMSVAGFDDHAIIKRMGLSLTTVRQDFYAIGYRAAELLLEKIDNRAAPAKNLVFPVELIERSSSGPPTR